MICDEDSVNSWLRAKHIGPATVGFVLKLAGAREQRQTFAEQAVDEDLLGQRDDTLVALERGGHRERRCDRSVPDIGQGRRAPNSDVKSSLFSSYQSIARYGGPPNAVSIVFASRSDVARSLTVISMPMT